MDRMIKVTFQDRIVKEFPANTTLEEISHSFKSYYNFPILVAKVDNNLAPLSKEMVKKCDVDFYDRSSVVGNTVYSSSVQLMMIVAIKRLYGNDVDVMIEHSIDKGIYCEMINKKLTKEALISEIIIWNADNDIPVEAEELEAILNNDIDFLNEDM